MKKLALALGLAGLLAAAGWTVGVTAAEPPANVAASDDDVIHIGRDSRRLCGILLIDRRQLASDIPGVISFVGFREGDEVTEGELVAKLRDEVVAAELAVAQKKAASSLAIDHATKAKEFAEVEYEKHLELRRRDAVTPLELQRTKVIADRSGIEVEQAKLQKELDTLTANEVQSRLSMYHIKAPFDGVVTNVYKYPGEAIRQGDPIVEVVSTDRVRVEGYVPVHQAVRIQPGAAAEIRVANLDPDSPLAQRTFHGQIVFVDPTVTQMGVKVWAEVPNRDGVLREGLAAYMTIHTNKMAEPEKTARVGN